MNRYDEALLDLDRRLGILRDRIRAVAIKRTNGLYLCGRPGTSKTFTVRTTLENLDASYFYHDGHITPMGLFELLQEHCDKVIVLDDVSEIFKQKQALQILLAALGSQPDDTGTKVVKHRRQGLEQRVNFTGGVIAISNLELQKDSLLQALKSRVHYQRYEPTDEQIAALMYSIAANGFVRRDISLPPDQCCEVVGYLLAECQRLAVRPDIRLLVDKSLPDYMMWLSKMTETDWRDLVTSTVEEELIALKHTPTKPTLGRSERKLSEQELVSDIAKMHSKRSDRIAAWKAQTGKSERAFYRRLKEAEV